MEKYYVIARITARPEHAEALREAMLRNIPKVRAEKGCERYHLLVSREESHVFTMDEIWTDKAAFDAHSKAEHMLAHRERTSHMLACPTQLSICQSVDVE